jgi:hypothetical protein
MLPARTPNSHPEMEEARELFEQWRKTRKHREPIPPLLWDMAVTLAGHHSLYEVSSCLRLNYNDLKTRIKKTPVVAPAFIELTGIASEEYTVEMEKPSGERIRAKGRCTVTELIRAFFG